MPAWEWTSAGLQTNPAINAILADSGQINEGLRQWSVMASASVAAVLIIEHRDAANTTTLHSQGFFVPANGSVDPRPGPALFFQQNERIRVRLNAAITGMIQCSIFVE